MSNITLPIIKPSVGRVVWFYPSLNTGESGFARHAGGSGGPYAALIAHVWSDALVNLSVIDANGTPHGRTSVPLLQPGQDAPDHAFCDWMPFQKGQAAKTDAAEKTASASAQTEYRQPTRREELEYALVSGAASHLAQAPTQAGQIAQGIKTVLDALHPVPVLNNPHTGTLRDPVIANHSAFSVEEISRSKDHIGIVLTKLPVLDPGPDSLEREIAAKSTAPRVTPYDIKAEIVSEHYFTAWEGAQLAYWSDSDPANPKPEDGAPSKDGPLPLLTFCVLVLQNGFTVTGESACISPENFDPQIGRDIARANAIEKIWPLLGFRLRDELARPALTDADALADLNGTPRPDWGAKA